MTDPSEINPDFHLLDRNGKPSGPRVEDAVNKILGLLESQKATPKEPKRELALEKALQAVVRAQAAQQASHAQMFAELMARAMTASDAMSAVVRVVKAYSEHMEDPLEVESQIRQAREAASG